MNISIKTGLLWVGFVGALAALYGGFQAMEGGESSAPDALLKVAARPFYPRPMVGRPYLDPRIQAWSPTILAQACDGEEESSGTYYRSIMSGGRQRTYLLHIPPQANGTSMLPLVMNFHGWGKSGEYQEGYTGMSLKADTEGFFVVYPDGVNHSWNAGDCCPPAEALEVDDVAFVRDLVLAVATSHCIDPDRVYATGSSNGGMMTHRLGCEASDIFAAIAPASAWMALPTCDPPRPVPVIQTQGTADPVVPYWTAKASNEFWAAHNQCEEVTEQTYHNGGASCQAYTQCSASANVEFCEVQGMGHTWPTSESTMDWIDATDIFWAFFEEHPFGQ